MILGCLASGLLRTKITHYSILIGALFVPVVACAKSGGIAPSTPVAPPSAPAPPREDEAGVRFEKRKIKVGEQVVVVEVADTAEKHARGLMFRESLPEGTGMIFEFAEERPLSFWMKNTLIPLNIGYFDKQRKLIETHEMVPAVMGEVRPRNYPSSRPAMYALEVPKGWFARHKILPGARFEYVDKTR